MKGICVVQEFTEKDLEMFKAIAKLDQPSLKSMLSKLLKDINGYTVYEHETYIAAEGDIPIVLIAHMDTVFSLPPKDFYYDPKKGALWSPDGLGADDRAGVFAILKIIGSGLRPHIVFTTDEEVGGIGASDVAQNKDFFGDVRYIIQLDRRGSEDCVFYDCDNIEFIDYVEQFGFKETWGTFSDISIICPAWKVAGVNLSVGYYNEHNFWEILIAPQMMATIEKVKVMLSEQEIPSFKYVPAYNSYFGFDYYGMKGASAVLPNVTCRICHQTKNLATMIEVEDEDENINYYCGNCFDKNTDHISWCYNCGYAYEVKPGIKNNGLCYSCNSYEKEGHLVGSKENEGYC